MAKSQTTSNKKDNERKRQKKRKDKEQKREDRKLNSNKGKGFDSMMAYVDEFGNITSTPPEERTRVKAEDIQIGHARQLPPDPADLIRTGKVTFFNESKGFGFIKDLSSQESIFVHASGLQNPIKENDKVTFEVENGRRGPTAVRVKSTA